MIVQHPILWCAIFFVTGIAIGLSVPLPYYLPALAVAVIACTLLRKTRHWHDVLTLIVWLLLGCSRASVVSSYDENPQWRSAVEQKAKAMQTCLVTRLQRSGVSPQTLALTSALTVGKKDNLKHDTRQAYNQVGASHLLALSGMHLGIIYGFLYIIFIRWIRFGKWRWNALPFILLCLWGYALVAGMPVSLVRAALMLSILTVISLMQYHTDPLHPLSMSAIIILLIAPEDLFSISFQLSFAAVFFILALWRPVSELFAKRHWAMELLTISCIAWIATMPIVCYYFHRLFLLGPLLSIILIPMTTLIIYLALVAILLPVQPLGWALDAVVSLQQKVIDLAGDIPYMTLTEVYPSTLSVALVYAVMVIAIVRFRTRNSQ